MQKLIVFTAFLFCIHSLFCQESSPFRPMADRILNNCAQEMSGAEDPDARPALINMGEVVKKLWESDGYKFCQDAGMCGSVYVKFLIDPEGNYLCHIVVREEHPIYTLIYQDLIPVMKFSPGLKAGKPVQSWTEELKLGVSCGIN